MRTTDCVKGISRRGETCKAVKTKARLQSAAGHAI